MRRLLYCLILAFVPLTAHAQPFVPACANDPVCQAKYVLFDGYLQQMGLGVLMHDLPDLYKDVLAPHYPNANLSQVHFGYSNRQPPDNATADCDKIYFNNATYVENVRLGLLTESYSWLLHELRHFEQCGEVGGRDYFAKMWWDDLSQTELQAFLVEGDWIAIHDQMAMEGDADARASSVFSALRACCIHPGSDLLIRPLQVEPIIVATQSPGVGDQVMFSVDASHGATPLVYQWSVKNPSSSVFSQLPSTGSSGTFVPHQGGNWELRLRVRQNGGSSLQLTNDHEEIRTIYVDPKLPYVSGLTLSKNSVTGGESLQGTLQVSQMPVTGSLQVTLSASVGSVTVPNAITLTSGPGGVGSATFDISTVLAPATRNVTIEARLEQSVMTATFKLVGLTLSSKLLTVKDAFMQRELFELELMLDRPPPVPITVFMESSDARAISVPREVTFARGEQRKTISLKTADRVERSSSVIISGRLSDDRASAVETRVQVKAEAAKPTRQTRRQ